MAPTLPRDVLPSLLGDLVPPPATPDQLDAALQQVALRLVAEVGGVDDVTVVLTGPLGLPVAQRTARIAASAGGPGTGVAAAQGASWLGPCVTSMVGDRQVVVDRRGVRGSWPHLLPVLAGGGLEALVASPMRPASGGSGVLTAYSSGRLPDEDGRLVLAVLAAAAGAALDSVRRGDDRSLVAQAARAVAAEDGVTEIEGWLVLAELAGAWQTDLQETAERVSASAAPTGRRRARRARAR